MAVYFAYHRLSSTFSHLLLPNHEKPPFDQVPLFFLEKMFYVVQEIQHSRPYVPLTQLRDLIAQHLSFLILCKTSKSALNGSAMRLQYQDENPVKSYPQIFDLHKKNKLL